MKKSIITVLLSISMTVGSIGAVPAFAAEPVAEEVAAGSAEEALAEAASGSTEEAVEEVVEPETAKVEADAVSVDTTAEIEETPQIAPKYSIKALKTMTKAQLDEVAKEYGIGGNFKTKVDLVTEIMRVQGE
jgi:hypothetical protein